MGLFDTLAKQALGGFFGDNPSGMLSDLLRQTGGLHGLRDKFREAGLEEVFISWTSTGSNLPIQPGQLQQALGGEALQDLAGKLGMNLSTVLPLLSQFLPQVIDRLTPNGQIDANEPAGDQLQQALADALKGGLGSFFGRS